MYTFPKHAKGYSNLVSVKDIIGNMSRRGTITNADINDPLPLRPGNGSILSLKGSNRILCVANIGHISKENR